MSPAFEIPADSRLFTGHFPGRPILPGIAHLALALSGAALREVQSLKLRRPAGPGDTLDLLAGDPDSGGLVRFELRRGEEPVSQGVVRLAPADWNEASVEDWPEPVLDLLGDFPPVELLIPHGPPARLVSGVVEATAEGIVCRAEVPRDHPLVEGGSAPCFLGIEAAAQAAAVLEALGRRAAPGPRIGYLVGIRDARFEVPRLPAGLPFRATVRLHGSAPPLSIYQVTLEGAGGPVLAATISTYILAE